MGTNGYSPGFRKNAVRSMLVQGMSTDKAAQEYGISEVTAKKWREEAASGTPLLEVVESERKYRDLYKAEQEKRALAEKMRDHFAGQYFEAKAS